MPPASIEPKRIHVALEQVSNSEWGLCRNVVDIVYRLTCLEGADLAQLSRSDVAEALATDPRHARRLLKRLLDDKVLERVGPSHRGNQGCLYRFVDPARWLRVPWRHKPPVTAPERTPEIVRARMDLLCAPPVRSRPASVARYSSPQTTFAVSPQSPPSGGERRAGGSQQVGRLLRASSSQQIEPDPPTTTRATGEGDNPQARDRSSSSEAGQVGALTGGAKLVADAILRLGRGPVLGRLVGELAEAFVDIDVAHLEAVLAAIAGSAADQRPPMLVSMAVQMARAGACVPAAPKAAPRRWELSMEELLEQRARNVEWAEEAGAQGNEEVAAVFLAQVANYDERIAYVQGANT